MSAFVSSLSELFALFFQSFRVSALLPATVFVFGNAALVFPHLKSTSLGKFYYDAIAGSQTLVLLVLVLVVTYFLNVINFSVIRWFEGYPLLNWNLEFAKKRREAHRNRLADLKRRRNALELSLIVRRQSGQDSNEYVELTTEHQSILMELSAYYPDHTDRIAPTRFGNVIASAEDYPRQLYGIDAISMWPLIVPILTEKGYAKYVQREKSALDFLLNVLLVSSVLGFETIVLSLSQQQFGVALAKLIAVVVGVLIIYNLSIDAAMGWGFTIRTSFDLYRDTLRKALRIKQPDKFTREREYWDKASRFYGQKREDFGDKLLDYRPEAFQDALKDDKNPGASEHQKSV